MDNLRIRHAILGTLTIIWLNFILHYVKQINILGPIIFPKPSLSFSEKFMFIVISTVLALSLIIFAFLEFKNSEDTKPRTNKKILPLILSIIISIPIVSAYVFQQDLQNLTQTILDATVMDEDFDDVAPGEDPPGWEEESGNWYAVNESGNIVYYQDDDSDAEALSIVKHFV